MGFAAMNSKCNTGRSVGRLEQLLGMLRLSLRNEFLLLLEMEASRYKLQMMMLICFPKSYFLTKIWVEAYIVLKLLNFFPFNNFLCITC